MKFNAKFSSGIAAILFLLLCVWFTYLQVRPANLKKQAQYLSSKISYYEREFVNSISDVELMNNCYYASNNRSCISHLSKSPIGFFFYESDSLIRWTKSFTVSKSVYEQRVPRTIYKLQNGWYIVFKKNLEKDKWVAGLLPLKYEFQLQNQILKNTFSEAFPEIDSDLQISIEKPNQLKKFQPVYDSNDNVLFYLVKDTLLSESGNDNLSVLIFLVMCSVLLLAANKIAKKVAEKKGIAFGLIPFAIVTAIIFYFTKQQLVIIPALNHSLFRSELYGSGFIFDSLFDFLLTSVFIFWLVKFLGSRLNLTYPIAKPKWLRIIHQILLTSILYIFTFFIAFCFKTLSVDSSISFQLFNLISLNVYSLAGLMGLSLLLYAHLLLSNYVIKLIYGISLSTYVFLIINFICCAISVAVSIFLYPSHIYVAASLWVAAWLLLALFLHEGDFTLQKTSRLLTAILVYSVLSTYLFESLFEVRERSIRKLLAEILISAKDPWLENKFEDTYKAIEKDSALFAGVDTLLDKAYMSEKLYSQYLSKYLSRYDISILSPSGADSALYFDYLQRFNSSRFKSAHIRFCEDSADVSYYLAVLSQNQKKPLLLRFISRFYLQENQYSRILLDVYLSDKLNEEGFSYAIYKKNKLIAQRGDYNYPLHWDLHAKIKEGEQEFIDTGEWEHNVLLAENGDKIVITVRQESLFEPVALFSYLFTFFLLFVIALNIAGYSDKSFNYKNILRIPSFRSFKARLNFSMLLIIAAAFFAVGFITFTFFSKQYRTYLADANLTKEKSVVQSFLLEINDFAVGNALDFNVLKKALYKAATINQVDVSFYNPGGHLTYTSQPFLFERGIISAFMKPQALEELTAMRKKEILEEEQIGNYRYTTRYYKIENSQFGTIGFLSFPQLEAPTKADDEIYGFVVALMNVYIFLLLGAVIISYFISNSVVRPLNYIAEKMQLIDLNKKNELIQWNSKDEIGVLVKQYNRMVRELEISAEKLARTEREGAWREMAKQIAHEIKNPLTPMKLSIQYLQKAIDEKNPRVPELAAKVTQTLIEQIDNLAAIATSFSHFAKMPKGQSEAVELNAMLQGICELFSKEKGIEVVLESKMQPAMVYADRNQLLSVFNNLVKNALQAIPDDRVPDVKIGIEKKHDMIQVVVSDNGVGIPEENYSKVFVPNFTTKSSGTGLGLAIAMQIVEGAGGAIWFESEVDKGTSFFVVLPEYSDNSNISKEA